MLLVPRIYCNVGACAWVWAWAWALALGMDMGVDVCVYYVCKRKISRWGMGRVHGSQMEKEYTHTHDQG